MSRLELIILLIIAVLKWVFEVAIAFIVFSLILAMLALGFYFPFL